MTTPKPQHPFHFRFQNLEEQRQSRIICRLRDAVLARVVAARPFKPINAADHINSGVERFLQERIPNVYTPTHPPYASMIQRAIEELNEEEGGVSEVAISKFIKREYEDLPWAHEGLLRFHLKKQCEIGVLVSLDGGRYNLNVVKDGDDEGSVDIQRESRRKRRPRQGRRGRGRWRGREEANESIQQKIEGGQGQNEVMGQSERPDMDQLEQALLTYIKLQNRGKANKDKMIKEPIEAGMRENEVIEDNNQREEQQSGEEPHAQQQQKRRPGRPKAKKVMDASAEALEPYAPEHHREEEPPKRRGRCKAKIDMNFSSNAEVPCSIEYPNEEEQPPKCRGPGRPPKPKPDSETSLAVLSSLDIQQQPLSRDIKKRFSKPKRGRGRPLTLRN